MQTRPLRKQLRSELMYVAHRLESLCGFHYFCGSVESSLEQRFFIEKKLISASQSRYTIEALQLDRIKMTENVLVTWPKL